MLEFAIVNIGAIKAKQFLNLLTFGSGFINSSLAISTTSTISSASSFFKSVRFSIIPFIISSNFFPLTPLFCVALIVAFPLATLTCHRLHSIQHFHPIPYQFPPLSNNLQCSLLTPAKPCH